MAPPTHAAAEPICEGRAPSRGAEREFPVLRGHMPALDGVRGLAVVMVLVFHFIGGMRPTNDLEALLCKITLFGAGGVELFFILSGFLITGILFDARNKPRYFRNFYSRRVLRIFPLYYGVLFAVFIIAPLIPVFQGPELDALRDKQGWAWLYGVNVYMVLHGAWSLSYLDHFWSLCIEEHFYFVWPFVVWLLAPRARQLMWATLSLAVGAMIARLVGNVSGLDWWTTYLFTPFRLDGLALGAFLAVLARQPGGTALIATNVRRVALAAGLLTAGTFAWVKVTHVGLPYIHSIRSSLFMVLLATLLMWALTTHTRSAASRLFRSRPMTLLGTYSYGLYVYHHFLSYYLVAHRTEDWFTAWVGSHLVGVLVQGFLGMTATAVIAYASYELFEKPFLSLKRFFESAPNDAAPAAPVPVPAASDAPGKAAGV